MPQSYFIIYGKIKIMQVAAPVLQSDKSIGVAAAKSEQY